MICLGFLFVGDDTTGRCASSRVTSIQTESTSIHTESTSIQTESTSIQTESTSIQTESTSIQTILYIVIFSMFNYLR
jgi:hypothetical protein